MIKTIVDKLMSGKFIFTVIAAYVFARLSLDHTLPPDKVHDIVLIVLYAYFTRQKEVNNAGK